MLFGGRTIWAVCNERIIAGFTVAKFSCGMGNYSHDGLLFRPLKSQVNTQPTAEPQSWHSATVQHWKTPQELPPTTWTVVGL